MFDMNENAIIEKKKIIINIIIKHNNRTNYIT